MNRWTAERNEGLMWRGGGGGVQELAESEWAAEAAALANREQVLRLSEANTALLGLAETLRHQATHDGLTGLLNKVEFERVVEEALQRPDTIVTLVQIDLDQFKWTNDVHGHLGGDSLLARLGAHLQARYRRSSDLASMDSLSGRIGGDEFAVAIISPASPNGTVLPEGQKHRDHSRDNARMYATMVLQEFGDALEHELPDHWHGASVGVAVSAPDSRKSYKELAVAADSDMYSNKRGGRSVIPVQARPGIDDAQRSSTTPSAWSANAA